MAAHVRVSSAYQELTEIHARVGGTWQEIQEGWVRVGGVWQQFFQNLFVDVDEVVGNSQLDSPGPVVANSRLDADGSYYLSDSSGSYGGASGVYTNDAPSVWVERTIDSGTLTDDDIGGSRVQLNVDREMGVTRPNPTGPGTTSATVTFNFYDASSGGNLLGTKQVTYSAQILP